jgi:uncharacterized protein (TIGR02145 family)
MKKIVLLLIVVIGFGVTANAQEGEKSVDGVEINGIIWATGNVENGKFVSPNEYGERYDWSNAKNACPNGWRLPTKKELQGLRKVQHEWAITPVPGRIFGTKNNTIFLPAAGGRNPKNGNINNVGTKGGYWSSSAMGSTYAYGLLFSSESVPLIDGYPRWVEQSVRCVKDK